MIGKQIGWTVVIGLAIVVGSDELQAQAPQSAGQLSISADSQEANTGTGVIVARGNVRIEYPARKVTATAEQATYSSKEKKIILTGNVSLIQDENRINAEKVTYFIDKGLFQADPKSKQQVRSTYNVSPTALEDVSPNASRQSTP